MRKDWQNRWQEIVTGLPELAPYAYLVEAFEKTAEKLGIAFPGVAREQNPPDFFIFNVSDKTRTVQIWPFEDRGYYSIELYELISEREVCYKGETNLLEEATLVISRWFVERCSIDDLHTQFPWMSNEPFRLDGPRISYES